MDVQAVLTTAQEAMTVQRVFGEPIHAEGTTIVPVAEVGGGGGGGGDKDGGGGFGLAVRPAGVFVVRDGDAHWRPAVDVNRIVRRGQLVAITALLTLGPVVRVWLSRRLLAAGA
jgi:uncharacterized spore protein YtfJ